MGRRGKRIISASPRLRVTASPRHRVSASLLFYPDLYRSGADAFERGEYAENDVPDELGDEGDEGEGGATNGDFDLRTKGQAVLLRSVSPDDLPGQVVATREPALAAVQSCEAERTAPDEFCDLRDVGKDRDPEIRRRIADRTELQSGERIPRDVRSGAEKPGKCSSVIETLDEEYVRVEPSDDLVERPGTLQEKDGLNVTPQNKLRDAARGFSRRKRTDIRIALPEGCHAEPVFFQRCEKVKDEVRFAADESDGFHTGVPFDVSSELPSTPG